MDVDDRLYARIQFTASRILSNVQMISDGSLLTGCSMMTCWSQLSGSTQRCRRCFDGEAVEDLLSFNFAGVMLLMSLTFLRRCPAVHSLQFFYFIRPQPNFDEFRGGVKSSNYYTLVTNDFHQFKINSYSPKLHVDWSVWMTS